jgi:HSP20 family molecular chaperone IbpA
MTTQTLADKNDCCGGSCESSAVEQKAVFTPRVDIVELEDKLVLYSDLPGVAADSIEVRFEDRELIIEGKVAPRYSSTERLVGEYEVGDFRRSFSIGEAVDATKITAELDNGVLKVHLPKAEEMKPRKIEVTVA